MNDDAKPLQSCPVDLQAAVGAWEDLGDPRALERWLSHALDADGAPVELPLEAWPPALALIAQARVARPGWPARLDERSSELVRMLMRFSRPDGRPAVVPAEAKPRTYWKLVSSAFHAPDVERVLSWWLPGRDSEAVPPPMPAWSSPDRVLGVLRADWTPRGDFLAFDQRQNAGGTRFELFGAGVPWFGPTWSPPAPAGATAPASASTPTAWGTNSSADVAEWTFRLGDRAVARLALMLRGRRLAILGNQIDGVEPGEPWETWMGVPEGLAVETIPDDGGLVVRKRPGGKAAQLAPVSGGRLSFDAETRRVSLVQTPRHQRLWLATVVSWDSARNRKRPIWMTLTVAERGKACPPDVAWAARVAWGGGDSFVIYRSLGPAERRSFLGCTTTARFFVGRFATPEGDVEPIVTLA